jgi:hypothetical protein
MNEDTRIIVCCYEGDAHQINLDAMRRHECPVTIMSPEDSRAEIRHEGVDCAFAGKRAYIGQDSLDRQLAQMKKMLTYPEKFFLMHDSDSVLLDAKIPAYLYEDPNIVWSNQVDDAIPEHQATFQPGWPHVAFQPPYFCSREVLEKLVAAGESGDDRVKATPVMPFIDYYMVQLTMVAGLPWRRLMDCVSCPIAADPRGTPAPHHLETLAMGRKIAYGAVLNHGAVFAHSIKNPAVVNEFIQARQQFLRGKNGSQAPQPSPPPKVGRGPAHVSHRQGRHRDMIA